MLRNLKGALYFFIANYFLFFAQIQLKRWSPRIVIVTGSNGKTTALHMLEAQLGLIARYSHDANSTYGIPFDILGLKRESFSPWEWAKFVLLAPHRAFKQPYAEKIYVVEADCDRPGEGAFLSSLLKPEVTVWLSCARTHSQNFDRVVHEGKFPSVDQAIAHEFGYFLEKTTRTVIINADNPLIESQTSRTDAQIMRIELGKLKRYDVSSAGTKFETPEASYSFPYLLPKETFYAIRASELLAQYFKLPLRDLSMFQMPPGRSSIFKGIKNTTIIDSSYNANASSVTVFLTMVAAMAPSVRWLIAGDMIEQGAEEKEEHEKVARLIDSMDFQKIILVGPRLKKYALPLLQTAMSFENPKEALEYLQKTISGGETLAFKGARFLEGIIEHLLADKKDADKLCRREKVWQKRRRQWQL
jgi:UDP-N-acetylmuramoyl-tripeptide--D-alanyl-D-alanine ligase